MFILLCINIQQQFIENLFADSKLDGNEHTLFIYNFRNQTRRIEIVSSTVLYIQCNFLQCITFTPIK